MYIYYVYYKEYAKTKRTISVNYRNTWINTRFFAVSNPMPHSTNTVVMATSLFTTLKACTVCVAKKGLHFPINYLAEGKGLESSLRILVL
jgi:hypothetical protein